MAFKDGSHLPTLFSMIIVCFVKKEELLEKDREGILSTLLLNVAQSFLHFGA